MEEFEDFWDLYNPDAEYNNRRSATCREWQKCDESKRKAIMEWLQTNRPPAKKNPFFFIQDFRIRQPQIMSFDDYYAKYGTTEERDGWHMENPTGNQVIYVK